MIGGVAAKTASSGAVRGSPRDRISYQGLLLIGASVYVEIGLCIWTYHRGMPPWQTGLVLAAFQTGYPMATVLAKRSWSGRRQVLPALVLLVAASLTPAQWLPSAVAGALLSASLQSRRAQLAAKGGVGTTEKNVVKGAAMVAASSWALPDPAVQALLASLALILAAALPAIPASCSLPVTDRVSYPANRVLSATEFLHHAHYFSYCYLFWRIAPIPPGLVGPLFVPGWLAYFVAERLAGSGRVQSLRPMVAGGHLLASGALVGMTLVGTPAGSILQWAITGVGGGSAYLLRQCGPKAALQPAEDAGHIGGCLIGAAIVATTGQVQSSTAAGATLAMATALAIMFLRTNEVSK